MTGLATPWLEASTTLLGTAENRVAILCVGPECTDAGEFAQLASLVARHRAVELRDLRSFHADSSKSPFSKFPWKNGAMHLRYVCEADASVAPPAASPAAAPLASHRAVRAVVGVAHCPSLARLGPEGIKRALDDYHARCRAYPGALTGSVFAFEPPRETGEEGGGPGDAAGGGADSSSDAGDDSGGGGGGDGGDGGSGGRGDGGGAGAGNPRRSPSPPAGTTWESFFRGLPGVDLFPRRDEVGEDRLAGVVELALCDVAASLLADAEKWLLDANPARIDLGVPFAPEAPPAKGAGWGAAAGVPGAVALPVEPAATREGPGAGAGAAAGGGAEGPSPADGAAGAAPSAAGPAPPPAAGSGASRAQSPAISTAQGSGLLGGIRRRPTPPHAPPPPPPPPPPRPATLDDELRAKRRLARLRKAMADRCLLAGAHGDAVDHYASSADLARSTGEWHFLYSALHGLAASRLLDLAAGAGLLLSGAASVFREEKGKGSGGGGGGDASGDEGSGGGGAERSGEGSGAPSSAPSPEPPSRSSLLASHPPADEVVARIHSSSPFFPLGGDRGADAASAPPPPPGWALAFRLVSPNETLLAPGPLDSPALWRGLAELGAEELARPLLQEAANALLKAGSGSAALSAESALRQAHFLARLSGEAARERVRSLVAQASSAASWLPAPEDRITAALEAATSLEAAGAPRAAELARWRAAERAARLPLPGPAPPAAAPGAAAPARAPGPPASPASARAALAEAAAARVARLLRARPPPPRFPAAVRAGVLEAALRLAIARQAHADAWGAASALLREHASELTPGRQGELLGTLAAATARVGGGTGEGKAWAGPGPPPILASASATPPAAGRTPLEMVPADVLGSPMATDAARAPGMPPATARPAEKELFLYDPFAAARAEAARQGGPAQPSRAVWVAGELAAVELEVSNPTDVSIRIDKMVLEAKWSADEAESPGIAGGGDASADDAPADDAPTDDAPTLPAALAAAPRHAAWRAKPVALNIPPRTAPVRILLEGTPLEPGTLTVTGCRLEGLGGAIWSQPFEVDAEGWQPGADDADGAAAAAGEATGRRGGRDAPTAGARAPAVLADSSRPRSSGIPFRSAPALISSVLVRVLPPMALASLTLSPAGGWNAAPRLDLAPGLRLPRRPSDEAGDRRGGADEAGEPPLELVLLEGQTLRAALSLSNDGRLPLRSARLRASAPPSVVSATFDEPDLATALPLEPGAAARAVVSFVAAAGRVAAGKAAARDGREGAVLASSFAELSVDYASPRPSGLRAGPLLGRRSIVSLDVRVLEGLVVAPYALDLVHGFGRPGAPPAPGGPQLVVLGGDEEPGVDEEEGRRDIRDDPEGAPGGEAPAADPASSTPAVAPGALLRLWLGNSAAVPLRAWVAARSEAPGAPRASALELAPGARRPAAVHLRPTRAWRSALRGAGADALAQAIERDLVVRYEIVREEAGAAPPNPGGEGSEEADLAEIADLGPAGTPDGFVPVAASSLVPALLAAPAGALGALGSPALACAVSARVPPGGGAGPPGEASPPGGPLRASLGSLVHVRVLLRNSSRAALRVSGSIVMERHREEDGRGERGAASPPPPPSPAPSSGWGSESDGDDEAPPPRAAGASPSRAAGGAALAAAWSGLETLSGLALEPGREVSAELGLRALETGDFRLGLRVTDLAWARDAGREGDAAPGFSVAPCLIRVFE